MKKRLCTLLVALVLILGIPVTVFGGPGGDPIWPDPTPPTCVEYPVECDVEPVVPFRSPSGIPAWPPVSGPIQP